jgi:hypothetical protein
MNRYRIDIEIFEGRGGKLIKEGGRIVVPEALRKKWHLYLDVSGGRREELPAGQRFRYPREAGKLCPWLLGSMHSTLQTLMQGGTLPWRYAGTLYEKVIDQEGITTDSFAARIPRQRECRQGHRPGSHENVVPGTMNTWRSFLCSPPCLGS